MTTDPDKKLDALFAEARETAPLPDAALMSRIIGDAERELAVRAQPKVASRRSGLRDVVSLLGGWPALAGLATAAVAGVWIGVNPPALLETAVYGETVDYLPGFELLLEDGS